MTPPERLTIDVNVARDDLDRDRPGHRDAVELFDLARRGEVELATAPQGYRLDVEGNLAGQLRKALERERVAPTRQVAGVGPATYPGPDLIVGHYVEGFPEACDRIVASWRSHEGRPPEGPDRLHVETHVIERRDVFVTADRALRALCHRLNDEYGYSIAAMSVAEFLKCRS
ncbi:MAG TPA: hypothetical protein VKB73_08095 [Gaiellaceae bacterium]|nr:hypothetical protein [Gaiellaceae bacterium]